MTTQSQLTEWNKWNSYGGLATGVASGIESYFGAQAQQNAYDAQAKIAAMNAAYAEHTAHLTMDAGAANVQQVFQHTRAIEGRQKVGFAASGISLKSENVKNVLASTAVLGHADAQRALDNTYHRAYAELIQQANYSAQASTYRSAASAVDPLASAFPSLATSATRFANTWYNPTVTVNAGGGSDASPTG